MRALVILLLLTGTASAQWRPAWKAARIMPEVPREYARLEPVRASDPHPRPGGVRWHPLRWLPTPNFDLRHAPDTNVLPP